MKKDKCNFSKLFVRAAVPVMLDRKCRTQGGTRNSGKLDIVCLCNTLHSPRAHSSHADCCTSQTCPRHSVRSWTSRVPMLTTSVLPSTNTMKQWTTKMWTNLRLRLTRTSLTLYNGCRIVGTSPSGIRNTDFARNS